MSYPNAPSHRSKIGSPWLLLSEQEIAEWMRRHPEATTPSEPILRMLAWLEQEFAPAPDRRRDVERAHGPH